MPEPAEDRCHLQRLWLFDRELKLFIYAYTGFIERAAGQLSFFEKIVILKMFCDMIHTYVYTQKQGRHLF